ncbi:imidazole glycerol phosphate synthase subunit HisF [Candidatus Micrarchaeota archaeon]|nr:imidazole glycerol phosphate synthase subunit HisF [Candidatus Micrarchaeota archaeon]
MWCKRIIPCLDVKERRVVKGINFVGLRDAGGPVELARVYYEEGADELVFLDISATTEGRRTMVDVAREVAQEIFIPFTIGGGIRSVENIGALLKAGADKVSLNSAAISNPALIGEAAEEFGSQAVVVAIDAKRNGERWEVYSRSGTTNTALDAIEWAKKAASLGAGEILLTSIDRDGTKEGFNIALTRAVAEAVEVPVIASGGAGKMEDFLEAFRQTKASAALAASLFHYGEIRIGDLKKYLKENGVEVRGD